MRQKDLHKTWTIYLMRAALSQQCITGLLIIAAIIIDENITRTTHNNKGLVW